jgi:hypothetical protein
MKVAVSLSTKWIWVRRFSNWQDALKLTFLESVTEARLSIAQHRTPVGRRIYIYTHIHTPVFECVCVWSSDWTSHIFSKSPHSTKLFTCHKIGSHECLQILFETILDVMNI